MGKELDDELVVDARERAAELNAALLARHLTLATAESLTGGGLGDLVSAAPGASASYLGGVVAYASEVKVDVLGVSAETVTRHGVVSEQCAREMAVAVRRLIGADVGVSTTGVAGPTTQEGKPVGTVYVGVADGEGSRVHELHLHGDRAEIRALAARRALVAVLDTVVGPSV